jgi:putative transposase
MATPAAGRLSRICELDFGMSERRARKAIGCCRMTMRYKTTRADDAGLRQRMKAVSKIAKG